MNCPYDCERATRRGCGHWLRGLPVPEGIPQDCFARRLCDRLVKDELRRFAGRNEKHRVHEFHLFGRRELGHSPVAVVNHVFSECPGRASTGHPSPRGTSDQAYQPPSRRVNASGQHGGTISFGETRAFAGAGRDYRWEVQPPQNWAATQTRALRSEGAHGAQDSGRSDGAPTRSTLDGRAR
jgi:hypothetical protein